MEIKDRFKEGMVFLKNSPTRCAEGVSCLLCGEFIETNIPTPRVCSSCKELWKELKGRKVGDVKD
jgi:hypothetical protein